MASDSTTNEAHRDGNISRVAVFGGTGFLGGAIVTCLRARGVEVRVATRHPRPVPEADAGDGGVTSVAADIRDPASVARALADCDAAVNAVGLYVESGVQNFGAVHVEGAATVAGAARAAGLRRLVHVSGIGADPDSRSPYVRARAAGEAGVWEAFPKATILRPSVLFGPSDKFVNTFAALARFAPALPLFGRGDTRLQPVHVEDAAEAARRCLADPSAPGAVYELGGPDVYRYRDLVEAILEAAGRRRPLVPVPFAIWYGLASVLSVLPKPPIVESQITLMRNDNVVGPDMKSFAALDIAPTSLDAVLPDYRF